MGRQPTTSLKILDYMKDSPLVSVDELIKTTGLGAQQVDAILRSMLKKGFVLHPHRGHWQISSEGINYLKNWKRRATTKREIIRKYVSGKTLEELAEEYPTSSEAVRQLLLKHCPEVIRSRGIKKKDHKAHTAILSLEKEQEIIKLYDKGKSSRQIGKCLGISKCSVLKVLHHYVPDKIRPPVIPAAKIKQQHIKLTPKKAFLIGHLIGDGCVTKKSYGIYYSNTCPILIEKVLKTFTNVYGLRGFISQSGEMLRANWNSKEAWKDLKRYTNYKCRKWKVPAELLENPETLGPPFLRALFDDDGCVALCSSQKHKAWQRWVCLRSINARGCEDIVRLLSSLGIHARKVDGAVIISGRENIKRFQLKIGFTKGVKVHRGRWKGLDKAEVLKILLDSYNNHSSVKLVEPNKFNVTPSLFASPAA